MRIMPTAAALTALLAVAGCSSVNTDSTPKTVTSTLMQVSPRRVDQVRNDIDAIVRSGIPGVIATLSESGQTVTLTSGVADRSTGAPIPMTPPQQIRVGSISKTFTSAIIMQLVAENKIRLDDSVDTYLPGLLVGDGVDGRNITIRQLLQHRSGLPELTDDPQIDEYRAALAGRTYTPAQEVTIALRFPAKFAPGTKYTYTNTNYIVAAMLIEKVTGRSYSEELTGRITAPFHLVDTYLPATGDQEIRGPHPHGYTTIDGVLTDATRSEPSVPWAAGAIISTGADLNHFYQALVSGQVVPPAQLQEMLAGNPVPGTPFQYALGIGSTQLSCGAQYFGHTGGIAGYTTITGATAEGRSATIAMTGAPDHNPDIPALMSHALCP
ncbi:beta-lactamase family protein [Nocardia sp. NBC_01503]|uniref:serine hydrolase domain-containing protein n=1 Tax=Nocardia sp. NBC_01503 TaxID=2975997 RepID=UPI002E7BA580|nr:serine hydrolase domain-containing protein [Nocardia sp. NBC_01503]WTL31249.1 beta-lactamase family protein [Nocardia sp. NBC_01503]